MWHVLNVVSQAQISTKMTHQLYIYFFTYLKYACQKGECRRPFDPTAQTNSASQFIAICSTIFA